VVARNPQASIPEGFRTGNPLAFLFGLTPEGVYQAITVACDAGALLPHHFTLTSSNGAGGIFSVALSRGFPRRELPGLLPCGARTFLVRAPAGDLARSSGQPVKYLNS